MNDPAPLRGIRVVDLGQWMAGPAAAMLLADNGADVVHVDPPGGPRWAGPVDATLNRGKSRVRLDLDDPTDLAEAHRLVAAADVVIENFRPGALARFGLDFASLQPSRPGLVYLSLPGFASTDADHAEVEAYEGVIASAVGQFADMGVNRVLMGVEASYSPLPLGSAYAAVFGAMAVTLALRARLQHGLGDHIEVPIASSLLEALSYNAMHVEDLPARYPSRREVEIARRRGLGLPMDLSYDDVQELLDPFYRTYSCADGRPFYVLAVSHRRHPVRVLELLGLLDEAVAAGLPMDDPYLSGVACTVYAHPISTAWSEWLSTRIAAVLATRPSGEWEELFAEHGIPAAAHRTTREWLASEHARASGLVVETTGAIRRMGPVAWLEPTGAAPAPVEAPGPTAGWLDGITVVDLTNVIAGPTIGSTLARFGARVIKVDPPEPTFDPWSTVLCGLHANRGKESLLLDVRHPDGRQALHRLLAGADVVTVNASSRQLAALGLTGDDLAAIAPQAVLCHLDAWSGPAGGPWRNRPGYDDLVQATTGITARFGGGLATPEEHAHFGTIDVLGGLCAALSTALALHARDGTGRVPVARTSLAAAGQLIQAPFLHDHADRGPWDEPSGPDARGESPEYGFHRASDGWMFVTRALPDVSTTRTVAQWCALLGAAVQPLGSLAGLRAAHTRDDTTPGAAWSASSFLFTRVTDHPAGRPVTLVAPVAVRPRRAAVRIPSPAPRYGEHTDAVLAGLGLGRDEIDALVAAGAAGRRWSEEYLPR